MAKQTRLLAALTLTFGTLPTHLAIATSAAPIPEVSDSSETTETIEVEIPSDSSDTSSEDSPPTEDLSVAIPPLYIKAVSPGYTVDKVSNTGEFIEIVNSTTSLVSLEGISLWYNNGTKDYLIYSFPEYSFLAPGSLVLRLKSSPEVKNAEDSTTVANMVYTKDLAMSGSLSLIAADTTETTLDSICWTGKSECAPTFTSAHPSVLVRDLETFELVQLESYEPDFNAEVLQIILPAEPVEGLDSGEDGADEIGKTSASDPLDEATGTSTSVKSTTTASSSTSTLAPCPEGKYRNPETNRCKNIEVESEPKTCNEGYYLNPDTNRCKKVETPAEPKICEDGYYLNPATNRCNKLPTEKELTPCKEGYERNPETNRCRKVTSAEDDELAPCAEGYERNPDTNRCRKIKTNDGADYALVPTTGGVEQKNFTALWVIGGVALVGIGAVIFQFRHELGHFFRKLFAKLSRK